MVVREKVSNFWDMQSRERIPQNPKVKVEIEGKKIQEWAKDNCVSMKNDWSPSRR